MARRRALSLLVRDLQDILLFGVDDEIAEAVEFLHIGSDNVCDNIGEIADAIRILRNL